MRNNNQSKLNLPSKIRPTKEMIFKELVGCITTPIEEDITPKMIKSIWKHDP
jgi:hypothetical protein